VEFVGFRGSRRRRSKSTVRKEEGKGRVDTVAGRMRRIRVVESVKIAGGSEDEIVIIVGATVAFLAFQVTSMNWTDARIVLAGIVNQMGIAKRCIGINEVIGTSSKGDPFMIWGKGCHVCRERTVGVLIRGNSPRLPLVKGLPSRLDSTNDAVFEMGAILLHNDDRFLEEILLKNLLVQLLRYSLIDEVTRGHNENQK